MKSCEHLSHDGKCLAFSKPGGWENGDHLPKFGIVEVSPTEKRLTLQIACAVANNVKAQKQCDDFKPKFIASELPKDWPGIGNLY